MSCLVWRSKLGPILTLLLIIMGVDGVLAQQAKTKAPPKATADAGTEAAPGTPAENGTEHWEGTLKAGPLELRLIVVLELKDQGKWTGKLISVDQGNVEIPLDTVNRTAGLEFEVKRISAKYSGKIAVDGSSIEGTFTQAGSDMPLKLVKGAAPVADTLKEVWAGVIKAAGDEVQVQLRILENGGKKIVRFDDLTNGGMGIPAELKPFEQGLKFVVPAVGGSFEGKWNATKDVAEGTWRQGPVTVPLILKLETQAADKPVSVAHPQTPVAPFPYAIEKVTLSSLDPDVTLAGTLTIPEGKGPFPAVILVSGSGPQDRDETLLGHKPFWVLADHLSRHGIAVLRYDDRGTAESTGIFITSTSQDFAKDARGALAFLRKDPRINASRLGIVGHSEGGLIGSMLAASDEKLAHVVLMAGPGVPGDVIIETQTRAIAKASGLGDDSEGTFAATKELMKAIKENAPREKIEALIASAASQQSATPTAEDESDKAGADEDAAKKTETSPEEKAALSSSLKMFDTPWFRYFLTYDPRDDLKKAHCPILAVNGEKDLQVLVDVNLPEIEKALTQAKLKDFKCVRMPGLNHLFQTCKTGSPGEYRRIEQTLAPEFLELVEEWVLSH